MEGKAAGIPRGVKFAGVTIISVTSVLILLFALAQNKAKKQGRSLVFKACGCNKGKDGIDS